MATITISNAGGSWGLTGTWVGGVVPTSADDVVATPTSGSVTVSSICVCRSLDLTGYTGNLSVGSGARLNIGTSTANPNGVALKVPSSGCTVGVVGTGSFWFISTAATVVTITSGCTVFGLVNFSGAGSSYQLLDTWNGVGPLNVASGALDTMGNNVTSTTLMSTGALARALTLRGSTVTLTAAGVLVNISGSGFTFDAGTSNIICTNTTASAKTFSGGGKTFYNVSFVNNIAALTFANANTFNVLTISGVSGVTIRFPFGMITTVAALVLAGSAGNVISVISSFNGGTATLSCASGVISCDYLSLKDITVQGGAAWYAGANSTNVSNNNGWIWTAPPAGGFSAAWAQANHLVGGGF